MSNGWSLFAPKFSGKLNDITLMAGSSRTIVLSPIIGQKGKVVSVKVYLNKTESLPDFIVYEKPSKVIHISPKKKDEGTYLITVQAYDSEQPK